MVSAHTMGLPGGIIVMIITTIVMMIAGTDTGTTKEPELAVTTTIIGPVQLEAEQAEEVGGGQEDDNTCRAVQDMQHSLSVLTGNSEVRGLSVMNSQRIQSLFYLFTIL